MTSANPLSALLQSKAFWAALVGLFVAVAAQFVPGFSLDEEQLVSMVVVLAGYITGVSLDPGSWRTILSSRKFWLTLVSMVFLLLPSFGVKLPAISADALVEICMLMGVLVAGIGVNDVVSNAKLAKRGGD